jgi:hypothetical protein
MTLPTGRTGRRLIVPRHAGTLITPDTGVLFPGLASANLTGRRGVTRRVEPAAH